MIGLTEKSLQRALNAAACRELPKAVTEEDASREYWTKAIALVRKRDQSRSYCLVERGADGVIRYKADFGNMSAIYGLVSVHPYVVVDVERFGFGGTLEDFKAHMRRVYRMSDEDVAANTDEEWRRSMIGYAIEAQEESDRRFRETGVAEVTEPEEEEKTAPGADGVMTTTDGVESGITFVAQSRGRKGRPKKK